MSTCGSLRGRACSWPGVAVLWLRVSVTCDGCGTHCARCVSVCVCGGVAGGEQKISCPQADPPPPPHTHTHTRARSCAAPRVGPGTLGAPRYTGAAWDIGGGGALLEIGAVGYNPDADLFARVEAATGTVTYQIPDPNRAACVAAGSQCNQAARTSRRSARPGPGLSLGTVTPSPPPFAYGVGVWALQPGTGKTVWSNVTLASGRNDFQPTFRVAAVSTPAPGSNAGAQQDLVIIAHAGRADRTVALDAATGAEVWSVPNLAVLPPSTPGCPVGCVTPDDTVGRNLGDCASDYAICRGCCCRTTGQPAPGRLAPGLPRDDHGCKNVTAGTACGSGCADCRACNATGINAAATWELGFLEPSPDGDAVYLGLQPSLAAAAGQVVAISTRDGRVLWRGPQDTSTPFNYHVVPGSAVMAGAELVVQAASMGGYYAPINTPLFQGLARADGTLLWTRNHSSLCAAQTDGCLSLENPAAYYGCCPPPMLQGCAFNCTLSCATAVWAGDVYGVLDPRTGTSTQAAATAAASPHVTVGQTSIAASARVVRFPLPPPPGPPPPPPKPECQPARGCNVCAACCHSYIVDGAPCADCVHQQCSSPPPPPPPMGPAVIAGTVTGTMCAPGAGGMALWRAPLPLVNGTGGGIDGYTPTESDFPWNVATVIQPAGRDGAPILLVGGHAPGATSRAQRPCFRRLPRSSSLCRSAQSSIQLCVSTRLLTSCSSWTARFAMIDLAITVLQGLVYSKLPGFLPHKGNEFAS